MLRTGSGGGGLDIRVGTNQLQGESPGPLDGVNGYNFEYVMLIAST